MLFKTIATFGSICFLSVLWAYTLINIILEAYRNVGAYVIIVWGSVSFVFSNGEALISWFFLARSKRFLLLVFCSVAEI
ncbi:membrane protein [Candidatus Thiomargarita nelsonii]|uniref:Membrane protein n=1 Tax=Candidatus Thiomargarita nelsonii TaxID=1003181 RepID=A0A176RYD5_9GAMM|nr:membrane protein [Candidatus Thiomargarita nelsonii]